MKIPMFDPVACRDDIIKWIKKYFAENGTPETKAVIGISGGKDSTIAAALLVRALGKDKVIGVLMPCGEQADIEDARRVVSALDIQSIEINIGETMEAISNAIPGTKGKVFLTNTPARLRMTTLYGVAAQVGGRVCHTGNRSEMYVGYTTKYGDLAGDFSLFLAYTATEVIEIGKTLPELPEDLVNKAPSDGMCGSTDEENLGFTYFTLDNYILNGAVSSVEDLYNIRNRFEASHHKTNISFPCPSRLTRKSTDPDGRRTFYSDWTI